MPLRLTKVCVVGFFGFISEYELELDSLIALVGPNNAGKTSILRTIQFAYAAFRNFLFNGDEPNYQHIANPTWQTNVDQVANRIGIRDVDLIFSEKSRVDKAIINLFYQSDESTLTLRITCEGGGTHLKIDILLNNQLQQGSGEQVKKILRAIYHTKISYLPSFGQFRPVEKVLTWVQLQQELSEGRFTETWRNQLHWDQEGSSSEVFNRIADLVEASFSGVEILPPRRSKQDHPNVIVDYKENKINYDISASGSGMRTLLSVAASVELAGAIVLMDEPDAHLHSELQRRMARMLSEQASGSRQIVLSTHAPDMIDELPIDSLRWVDRRTSLKALACDDIGKTLVHLGAVSQNQALLSLGANILLYFEDKPDKDALLGLMKRCGKEGLAKKARSVSLKGCGDSKHLHNALRVLKSLLPMKVAVVAILDADYTQLEPKLSIDDSSVECLVIHLPCKELENLLILSPDTITLAAKSAAEQRAARVNGEPLFPSRDEVESKIEEITGEKTIRDDVEVQWEFRWLQENGGLTDPGQFTKAKNEFAVRWEKLDWRRRYCPGKAVLAKMRQWLQSDPWKVSVNLPRLFDAFTPGEELQNMFNMIEAYVEKANA